MSYATGGQHHQAFENFWVSNSGAIQIGASAIDLAPQAIGFYNCGANCEEENLSISSPNIKKTKRMKIKMGLTKTNGLEYISRQSNNPIETHCFTASDIISYSGKKSEIPNKGNWRQQKIALGYDGFDTKKSLNAKLDVKPLLFTFILQGDPIQRYFGQNQVSYEFAVNKGLCLGSCDCFDECGKVDCRQIIKGLKDQMSWGLPKVLSTGVIVKRPITDFINVDAIGKCNPTVTAPTPTFSGYKKWSLSLCDDGATTISQLAAQFPTLKIFQDGRSENISTYSTWIPYTPGSVEVSTFTVAAGTTSSTATITVTINGVSYTTASITSGATRAQVIAAIALAIGSKATTTSTTVIVTETSTGNITNATVGTNTTGLTVTVASTNGVADIESIPANFTLTTHVMPICGSCPTCPDVYTPVAGTRTIQVRKACGAAAPVIAGAITTTLMSNSLSGGDAYLVTVPSTVSDATIDAALTGCIDYMILSDQGPSCVGTSVSFVWKACESCNKTEKEYMIVLSDKDCPSGDHLAELQATYPTLVIAEGQEGSCARSYVTTVLSDCVKDSEDCLIDTVNYSFVAPSPFKGRFWEDSVTIQLDPNCEVAEVATDCCVCGLVVEGKAFHKETLAECTPGLLEHNPGDVLGVRVHVTCQSYDPTGNPCDSSKEYITVLQDQRIPLGTPGSLLQKYEKSRLAYENKFYSGNYYMDQANGFNLVAKVGYWYDHYRLVLRGKLNYDENRLMKGVDDMAYNFYFASGKGKDFETHMNSLILSTGNPDLNAVVL